MRAVYIHHDHARVGFYRSILEEAGIATFLKNDASFNTTEVAALVSAPTLCVVNDDDFDRARQLIKTVSMPAPSFRADWTCPQCGEEVPGNFDSCWQCGFAPETAAPAPSADA